MTVEDKGDQTPPEGGEQQAGQGTQGTQGEDKNSQGTQAQEGNLPKAVAKLQMTQANQNRQIQQVLSHLNELSQTLQRSDSRKTQGEGQAVQDTLDGLSDDDSVDAGTLRKALDSLATKVSGSVQEKVTEALGPVQEQGREARVRRYWEDWEKAYPNAATQRDDLLDKARTEVDTRYGGLDDSSRAVAVQTVFDRLVDEVEAGASGTPGTSGKDKDTLSKKPPQSTEGTRYQPEGSSNTAGGQGGALPEPGPLWIPDE